MAGQAGLVKVMWGMVRYGPAGRAGKAGMASCGKFGQGPLRNGLAGEATQGRQGRASFGRASFGRLKMKGDIYGLQIQIRITHQS